MTPNQTFDRMTKSAVSVTFTPSMKRLRAMVVAATLLAASGRSVAGDQGYYERFRSLQAAPRWFESSSLVDTNNRGPDVATNVLAVRGFFERGEYAGVRLGMTMSEVVEVWGKPRALSPGCGIGPRLYYGDTISLIFREDQLALIALWGRLTRTLKCDVGPLASLTAGAVTESIGAEAEALPDDGCYDGQSRWRSRGTRMDLWRWEDPSGVRHGVQFLAVRLLGAGELRKGANAAHPLGGQVAPQVESVRLVRCSQPPFRTRVNFADTRPVRAFIPAGNLKVGHGF